MKKFDAGTFLSSIPWWFWVVLGVIILASILISPAFLIFALLGPLDEIIIIVLVIGGITLIARQLDMEGHDEVLFIKLYVLIFIIFTSILIFIIGWWGILVAMIISLILSPIIYITQHENLGFLK